MVESVPTMEECLIVQKPIPVNQLRTQKGWLLFLATQTSRRGIGFPVRRFSRALHSGPSEASRFYWRRSIWMKISSRRPTSVLNIVAVRHLNTPIRHTSREARTPLEGCGIGKGLFEGVPAVAPCSGVAADRCSFATPQISPKMIPLWSGPRCPRQAAVLLAAEGLRIGGHSPFRICQSPCRLGFPF
jgi:hypothetical protein